MARSSQPSCRRPAALLAAALALSLAAPPSSAAPAPNASPKEGGGVSDFAVQQAIGKGLAYLAKAPSPAHTTLAKNSDELICYTLRCAGVPESDPTFKKWFSRLLRDPLERTYKVALQAMLLQEIDPVRYKGRLWQCAQFLVDNQCKNGQWSYGQPRGSVKELPPGLKPVGEASPDAADGSRRTVVRVPVRQTEWGPDAGDNSISQYAALGLRACHDAGIGLPETTVLLAVRWWYQSQFPSDPKEGPYGGRGWNYKSRETHTRGPYHAMTAGAVGAMAIYEYIRGNDWKRNPCVKEGVEWLTAHWSLGGGYYYLYGLERAGVLCDVDAFGDHAWYPEGTRHLLKNQNPDGSWGKYKEEKDQHKMVWDTCFAILFLRRATRPLVYSGPEGGKH